MSTRTTRRLLWLAGCLLVPVPLVAMSTGFVPPARQLMLGTIAATFAVLESPHGAVMLVTGVLLGQAVLWGVAFWLLAWLIARALAPLRPSLRASLVAALVAAGVLAAVARPVYTTPFSATRAHSTLLEVYR